MRVERLEIASTRTVEFFHKHADESASAELRNDLGARKAVSTLNLIACAPTPLVLLDDELNVLGASEHFLQTFATRACNIVGLPFFDCEMGLWGAPEIRSMIDEALTKHANESRCQIVQHDVGENPRYLLLTARRVPHRKDEAPTLLLGVCDETHTRAAACDRATQRHERAALLHELESRRACIDNLCESMGVSVSCANGVVSLHGLADDAASNPRMATELGVIVTEMVIRALTIAYPDFEPGDVTLGYQPEGPGWTLSLRDSATASSPDKSPLDSIVFIRVAAANAPWAVLPNR